MTRTSRRRIASVVSSLAFAAGLSISQAFATGAPPPPPEPGMGGMPGAAILQQAPSPMDAFRETLRQFGSFETHPLYGEVWKPSEQIAMPGWSPYPRCHWQFDREQRTWVFADPTPWGAIVHRHGRWANDPQHGWIWAADANFGPGWVVWRAEPHQVSWAPMLPEQHGNQPPREGWQTQDQASFNSGCRQAAPPAPAARIAPPMAPVAPAMSYGGPDYGPGPGYIGGGTAFIPGGVVLIDRCRHRPWAPGCRPGHVGLPPSCSTGIRPSWCRPICATNPFAPGCRRPGHVVGGVRLPPGATPGPLGSLCGRNPAHPACRQVRPLRPGPFIGRPGPRPGPFIGRPAPRPGPFIGRPGPRPGPFMGRPGPRPGFAMGGRGHFGGRFARR